LSRPRGHIKVNRLIGPLQGVKLPQALGLVLPGLGHTLGIGLDEAEHPRPLEDGGLGLGQVGI
jgi:hypothetical protein